MSTVRKSFQSYLKLHGNRNNNNSSSNSGSKEQLGIVSILGSSENRVTKAGSMRRTFSADMSSKTWLVHHQLFSPPSPSLSNEEKEEAKTELDVWSSIQNSKKSDSNSDKPNYIHPLVKRASTCLSKKSLEICTESLGSETGFDSSSEIDSSFGSSDGCYSSKEEKNQHEETGELKDQNHGFVSVNYNCSVSRKSPTRSFPPPLPSISRRDGPCFQMRSVRHEGRLVLQSVPVPSQSYLHAQRQDGRLILSFINSPIPDERKSNFSSTQVEKTHEIEIFEPKFEIFEENRVVIKEEDGEEKVANLVENKLRQDERKPHSPNTQVEKTHEIESLEPKFEIFEEKNREEVEEEEVGIKLRLPLPNLDPSTLVINKIISRQFVNLNLLNQKIEKEQVITKVTKRSTFNDYYSWRRPLQQEQQVLLRDKGELPSRWCKDHGRPFLGLERFCIATS